MVGQGGVRVTAVGGVVGVHGGGGQPRYGVDQGVLGCDGQGVGLDHGEVGVDDDVGLGAQGVADPPHPDLPDAADAVHRVQRIFGGVDQGGVDGVHQAAVDLAGGIAQHHEDRGGDEQADDRVGGPPAQRGGDRPQVGDVAARPQSHC